MRRYRRNLWTDAGVQRTCSPGKIPCENVPSPGQTSHLAAVVEETGDWEEAAEVREEEEDEEGRTEVEEVAGEVVERGLNMGYRLPPTTEYPGPIP